MPTKVNVIETHKHRKGRLEIYRDKVMHWRWRLVARNGRIIACSSEGYQRRVAMVQGLVLTCTLLDLTLPNVE